MNSCRHRKRWGWMVLGLLLLAGGAQAQELRFGTLELELDCGEHELAAWQVALRYPAELKIVGLEGVGDGAFGQANPPRYDAQGLEGGRIVLAGFSTVQAQELPRGKVRVVRIHYAAPGKMDEQSFEVEVQALADAGGQRLELQGWTWKTEKQDDEERERDV